jgi:protein-arginine kinase activator protein McsA
MATNTKTETTSVCEICKKPTETRTFSQKWESKDAVKFDIGRITTYYTKHEIKLYVCDRCLKKLKQLKLLKLYFAAAGLLFGYLIAPLAPAVHGQTDRIFGALVIGFVVFLIGYGIGETKVHGYLRRAGKIQ